MPTDRTQEFRERLQEFSISKERSDIKTVRRTRPENNGQPSLNKEYLAEAYNILNHVNTLTRMLASIRKPYLNLESRNVGLGRHTTRHIEIGGDQEPSWSNVKHLSNEEREQIDLQARVILTRSADRVKQMEALEKRRSEAAASNTSLLSRLVPARLWQDEGAASSDFIAAHHSSITWYLSRRLAEASQTQKEMQEERVKRQLERNQTLGSGAAREIANLQQAQASTAAAPITTAREETSSGNWLSNAPSNLIAAAIGAPSPSQQTFTPPPPVPTTVSLSEDEDDDDIELTQSQILQFEAENASILRGVQDTLESVQQAEARLMDISALQMELVNHLTQQTEVTEQLYEDAIATTGTVDKGNEQLKEAKRRAKDSRFFILIFLLGASMSLLFLHYY